VSKESAWSAVKNGAVRWREWDGEYVVFDESTGGTHLLAAASGAVLILLGAQPSPLCERDIAKALGSLTTSADNDVMSNDVATILAELERIGLVVRTTT
jgi:PqqD family protein of HPr-rel-A system